jgi:hypothetical protein
VFLKAPRPGRVKTRLAKTLGAEAACAAYRHLVETLLHRLANLDHVDLCHAPDEAEQEILPWLRPGWRTTTQGAGDLGERLDRAFRNAFASGSRRVLVIGSDCPEITTADLEAGWSALESHDVVLGPAVDGGYWLVGLRAPQPSMFDAMPWSTSAILPATLDRCAAAGLTVQLLRTLADVDTEEAWRAYLLARQGGE